MTLADPGRRNAQDPSTWRSLKEIGESLGPEVRGVLLQADGPSFSAGIDRRMLTGEGVGDGPPLAALTSMSTEELGELIAFYQGAFTWWRRPDLVTVAAVQGHAVGAGFQLALACDLRIVSDDVQLSMKEPTLGLVPDLGGTWPLVEAVGYAQALEICLTGRWVGAEEAVRLGLALRRAAGEDLRADARTLLESLVAGPAHAAAETKALLLGATSRSYDNQRAAERAAQTRILHALGALLPKG